MGEAVAKFIVDEAPEDAMVLLDGAESFVVARRRERTRVWYFASTLLFAFGTKHLTFVAAGNTLSVTGQFRSNILYQVRLEPSLLKDARGVVMDVKAKLPRTQKPDGVDLWRM